MNFAALEDWNVQRAEDSVRRQHTRPECAPISPKFAARSRVGKYPAIRGAALQLRRNQAIVRRFVIGAQRIRALQAGFKIGDGKSLIRRFVGQFEFLPRRQSDHTRQRNLLLGEIIRGRDQLLLPRLVFNLRPERINRGSDPRLLLRNRLVVRAPSPFQPALARFPRAPPRDRLQIGIARREHDQIPRVFEIELGHAFADHRRTVFLDRLPVEDSLRRRGAHIKVGERTDNARRLAAREQRASFSPSASRLCFCADLLHVRIDVRKQVAELSAISLPAPQWCCTPTKDQRGSGARPVQSHR